MFAKITDTILLIDAVKHRAKEGENDARLDCAIEQLYELRMFADNIGSCQQNCSLCHSESIENALGAIREPAGRLPDCEADPAEKKRPHH